ENPVALDSGLVCPHASHHPVNGFEATRESICVEDFHSLDNNIVGLGPHPRCEPLPVLRFCCGAHLAPAGLCLFMCLVHTSSGGLSTPIAKKFSGTQKTPTTRNEWRGSCCAR